MSKILLKNNAVTPATPATGKTVFYIHSATKRIATKDDTGLETLYYEKGDKGDTGTVGAAAEIDLVDQAASIPVTTLFTPSEDGIFLVNFYYSCTAAGAAGTVRGGLSWSDDTTTQNVEMPEIDLSTQGTKFQQSIFVKCKAGEPVSYSATVVGATGSPKYSLYISAIIAGTQGVSIVGPKGDDGAKGGQGDQGPAGADGGLSLWVDIKPANGTVLPLSQPRSYYPTILYSATPIFNDGTSLRKYVSYYAGAASAQGYAAFSDDGITWDHETLITGVVGLAYHASVILVSGIIHFFYWDTTGSLYRPQSSRHATFNPSVSCVAATSDAPLTGTYITGLTADGLRYGTYGVDQAFYNASPTNNPSNPYSYQWCIIHNGTTGSQEGCLFATSTDGYNFSAWNGLNEVIPRGIDNYSNTRYIVKSEAIYTTVGGAAAEDITISGVVATDIVVATLHTPGVSPVTILNAKAGAGKITVTFSANPSNDHKINYTVLRYWAWDMWIGRINTFIDDTGLWHAYYSGGIGTSNGADTNWGDGLGHATSVDGITWIKSDKNPIIRKTDMYKSWKRLYTPWVIRDASGYKLYFSCKDKAGLYKVGYAQVGGAI